MAMHTSKLKRINTTSFKAKVKRALISQRQIFKGKLRMPKLSKEPLEEARRRAREIIESVTSNQKLHKEK